jgi:methylmalonyl-CoA mutase N-terminal domain/subunit
VTDMVEFTSREMPLWRPISVSGYHIREAGSTAAQALAFTLASKPFYPRTPIYARCLWLKDVLSGRFLEAL